MLDVPKTLFSYLAFETSSDKLLSYGQTAESARQCATEVAPSAEIEIFSAGEYGRTMWKRGFSMLAARRVLKKVLNETDAV